jgi:hypothetical protein
MLRKKILDKLRMNMDVHGSSAMHVGPMINDCGRFYVEGALLFLVGNISLRNGCKHIPRLFLLVKLD